MILSIQMSLRGTEVENRNSVLGYVHVTFSTKVVMYGSI